MTDLPADIARLMLTRLSLDDQIRFRAVCRNWSHVRGVKPRCEQPWLLVYTDEVTHEANDWLKNLGGGYGNLGISTRNVERSDSGVWSYFLYNPTNGKAHHCRVTLPVRCGAHPTDDTKLNFQILATSSGVLLMDASCNSERPFIYNPFSRRIVYLPRPPLFLKPDNYAFKYCPVQGRFTVYAAWVNNRKLTVSTWRTGDAEWKTNEVTGVQIDLISDMICDERVLYCHFSYNNKVIAFQHDDTSDNFEYVEVELPEELQTGRLFSEISLGVSDGSLFLVSMKSFYSSRKCSWHAMRLDLAERTWVKEENKERAYFYSDKFSTVVVSEPGEEFAGHVVGEKQMVVDSPYCTFPRTPVHIPLSDGNKGSLWSFLWPVNLLVNYDPAQLASLKAIWIETPTSCYY